MIADSIFREYDIRGVIGRDVNAEGFSFLGRAFATYVERQTGSCKVVVGYDGRLTSLELVTALIQGLTHSGAEVINIGCGPTPMLYFASYHLEATAAVMVTGSHNPPEYNGLKMVVDNTALMAEEIKTIGEMAQMHDFRPALGSSREDPNLASHYVEALLKDFTENYPATPQRIAWDAGNGATGRIVEALVKQLPGEHILLNTEIDGRFPNHHPDPTVEKNMRQLQDAVRANHCDYGIGFDGDGDRLGIVDDEGRMLYADQTMRLFAQEVLAHSPGATIIGDVKTSNLFFEKVAALGGVPLMWRTGHVHIKRKLRELQSPLAGEMSGHICFADRYFGFDDALYAALRFVGIRAQRPEKLSMWSQSLPVSFSTPEVLIPCGSHNKFHLVEEICRFLEADSVAFSSIDGMRVTTSGGWWLLRASNTQDFLVARIEEPSAEALAQTTQIVEGYLKRAGIAYVFSEAA